MAKRALPHLFLALSVVPLTTFSQEELAPVEVVNPKEAAPYTYGRSHVVEEQELRRETLPLFSQILDHLPGVTSAPSGGPGGRTSIFIRGTEVRHVAFTLDEMKLNDVSNMDRQFDAAFLTLPALSSVAVYHGPQSVVYGSDALGGLIEMRTRKGEGAPKTEIGFTGGSFGTFATTLIQDWKSGDHQGTLSLFRMRSEGISRLNKKRFAAKEDDASENTQITTSSRHRWNDRISTDVLASYIRGYNELDGNSDDNSVDESTNDQYLLQQKTSLRVKDSLKASLRTGLSRHDRRIESMLWGEDVYSGNLIQNELLVRNKGESGEFLVGFMHEHEEGHFQEFRPKSDLFSLFAQGLQRVGSLEFQAGLRGERHSRFGNFLAGSAGVAHGWSGGNRLALQFSRGYKTPALYQLFAPQYGNRDLNPETNSAWELKWEKKTDTAETGASLFQNHLGNLIGFTNKYENQNDHKIQGVEFWQLFKQNDWMLRFSGNHQRYMDNREKILLRPYNTAQVSGSWFPSDDQELFTKFKWVDSRLDSTGFTEEKLNPYETVDVGYRHVFGMHELTLQVINIFDREYEDRYGYSVLPRAYYAGYRITF